MEAIQSRVESWIREQRAKILKVSWGPLQWRMKWPPWDAGEREHRKMLHQEYERRRRQLQDLCLAVKADTVADLQDILCCMVLSECVYKVNRSPFNVRATSSLFLLLFFLFLFSVSGGCVIVRTGIAETFERAGSSGEQIQGRLWRPSRFSRARSAFFRSRPSQVGLFFRLRFRDGVFWFLSVRCRSRSGNGRKK